MKIVLSENDVPVNPAHISVAMPGDYIALMKPRVMLLVVFTALVAMLMSPVYINPTIGFIAIVCIAIGAGSAGALNMWYDADIDKLMKRTRKRPIPSGKISPDAALFFALTMAFISVITLGILVNWLSSALLAFTIFFYSVIYTIWLKRFTPQNIVIGGVAGALPPVIGWAAVTNSISFESLSLFAIIFIWTPPHSWALALFCSEEYERARIPMMPNVSGDKSTRLQILFYSFLLLPVSIIPWVIGFSGVFYGMTSIVLSSILLLLSWKVFSDRSVCERQNFKSAKVLFIFSIIYLFALFSVLLIEKMFFYWL